LRPTLGEAMETLIVGLIALLLFIYLLAAILRPERF
jgi:K+-transporting ATPase KdpF subunit